MQTETITVDREEARALYRKYQEHRFYSMPVDQEIARTYAALSRGKVVVRAIASIVAAGLGEDHLPKLAIVRADAPDCHLYMRHDGGCRFSTKETTQNGHWRTYIDLPPESFPEPRVRGRYFSAMTPLVPIHLRPKRGLANYHVLFEAEWSKVVPRDPLLLRRIGRADLWVVLAAWDLTEIERAVLAGRIAS